ncbi:hypothetical protein [Methylomonas sp. AM2-LC]
MTHVFMIAPFCAKHGRIVAGRNSLLCAKIGWINNACYRPTPADQKA